MTRTALILAAVAQTPSAIAQTQARKAVAESTSRFECSLDQERFAKRLGGL